MMGIKRAELHVHTNSSDDISFISGSEAFVNCAEETYGLTAVAFTNLNNVQDFPKIAKAAENTNLKIIYGAELFYKSPDADCLHKLTVLVKNNAGIKELYKIISALENDGECDYVPLETIRQYRKNLLIGSAGKDGELYKKFETVSSLEEIEKIAVLYDYFEVYPTNDENGKKINESIVNLGQELGVRVIAVSNAHYISQQFAEYRDKIRANEGKESDDKYPNMHLRIYDELYKEFLYLGAETAEEIVYKNPQYIADLTEWVTPVKEGCFVPAFENAFEEIRKSCYENAEKIYNTPLPDEVSERLETELDLINKNNFADIYYITRKIVNFAKENGHLTNIRGGAGASLVAFLLEITEIDPILYNIPYESFMGKDGNIVPDFDIFVPVDFRLEVLSYLQKLFGKDKVAVPGIVNTYGERFSEKLVGNKFIASVKKEDAIHPAGFMVIPADMEFEDFTPLNKKGGASIEATHLDFHDLHKTILKIDVIESDTLNLLEILQAKTGVNVKEIDINDSALFNALNFPVITDIPMLENAFIRSLIIKLKPNSFDELLKIIGFAHGTNVWKDNGEYFVNLGIPVSALPVFREDIMNDMYKLTNKDTAIKLSNAVRKGLFANGKAECDLIEEFKKISAPLGEWYYEYCSKIGYIFIKSQAVAEAINILKLIWFKTYYKKEYKELFD